MSPIARVEPLTTARALHGPFDYRLPSALAGVDVGSLLVVPFGRQRLLGVVVEVAERSEIAPERLAAPIEALELGVPAELVALAQWIAREYCSTPARALALVLPPGTGRDAGRRVRERRALVAELTAAGALALQDGSPLSVGQRAALERLCAQGPLAATRTGVDHGALRRLERRGLIALEARVQAQRPAHVTVGAAGAVPRPTDAQQQALAEISRALQAPGEPLLLHGVTGSGKTEVYLRAATQALGQRRGAIVLVPEIALTPQITARFRERLGETVAILHSQLGAGERRDEWLRLRRGQARVCVGPRSAVFAPIADLGLIIVDEEHDPSYKHEGDPRYDARSVAEQRARASNAVLVLGSATPRPESWQRLRRITLPTRVDDLTLPPVEVLDMRGARHALHPDAHEALVQTRRAGAKAIVLLNRRGWSNFLSCRSCGRVWTCPHCDVSLVLHRATNRIACHHCGHAEAVPERCPDCGSSAVARHGAGTERLAHELTELLAGPGFPVLRLDSDVAGAGRERLTAILRAFDEAPAGVLIGTQMVAKGHDFPAVTLGVVIDADATLRFPDFRAEERTFALVAQLAGRAGRGSAGGRVLVQTIAPDAPSIQAAARHDAEGFIAGELERRRALGYPPFAELIRIVCSAARPQDALAAASAVAERLVLPNARVLGPAPLFRLRDRERAQLVIRIASGVGVRANAARAVGAAVDAVSGDRRQRSASFSVDVDPQ